MNDIRIALSVFKSIPNDFESNIANTMRVVVESKQKGADIICFPEMNLTGYNLHGNLKANAQSISGSVSKRLLQLADRENIAILAGLAEIDNNGCFYASHLIALPQNKLHVYRKIHLAPPEKEVFTGVFDGSQVRPRSRE